MPSLARRSLVADAHDKRPVEARQSRVRDWRQIIEMGLIISAGPGREVMKNRGCAVIADQRPKRAGPLFFGTLRIGKRANLGTLAKELGRADRRLFEINRKAGLAMIAAQMPVTVRENLETCDADNGHLSFATISSLDSLSDAPCWVAGITEMTPVRGSMSTRPMSIPNSCTPRQARETSLCLNNSGLRFLVISNASKPN
jgi:hypothetical protein